MMDALKSNLARLRRSAGLSAEDLAHAAGNGLTRSVIANLENGRKSDLTVRQLTALCWALGVSPVDLLFDIRDPYLEVGLAELPAGKVSAPAWLARGWFAGQRSAYEIRATLGNEPITRFAHGESQGRLVYWIDRREHMLRALAVQERQLREAQNRFTDEPPGTYDIPGMLEDIRDSRANLYEIEKVLHEHGVNLNRPHVGPADPF